MRSTGDTKRNGDRELEDQCNERNDKGYPHVLCNDRTNRLLIQEGVTKVAAKHIA
jgi:hypothetical protein